MKVYWLWLALLEGLTSREKELLLSKFETPEDLFFAGEAGLAPLGLSQKQLRALSEPSLAQAEAMLAQCLEKQVGVLCRDDPRFPRTLLSIPDPPLVLYWKGRLPELNGLPLVGVVGTRKAGSYGLQAARELSARLACHGAAVVSGMAEGIDTAATRGALEAGGTVIGVLGCGADVVYPRSNRELFDAMVQWGCLLSEYPPGTPPASWHFPQRNRLISGLSMAVLVVEAPAKSGALITARHALEQGRDVFVVPGSLDQESFAGSLALLREGGTLVTCAWDILSEYERVYPRHLHREPAAEQTRPLPPETAGTPDRKKTANKPASRQKQDPSATETQRQAPRTPQLPDLEPEEALVLAALAPEDRHVDTLIAATGLPSARLLSALTMLEVKGYVITRPGGWARTSQNH